MVTDCFGDGFFEFGDTETLFLRSTFLLIATAIPGATILIAWKMLIANRAVARRTILGLDEATAVRASSGSIYPEPSPMTLVFCGVWYGLAGIFSFSVGLLSSAMGELLREVVKRLVK